MMNFTIPDSDLSLRVTVSELQIAQPTWLLNGTFSQEIGSYQYHFVIIFHTSVDFQPWTL
jgi:hypothetical protein